MRSTKSSEGKDFSFGDYSNLKDRKESCKSGQKLIEQGEKRDNGWNRVMVWEEEGGYGENNRFSSCIPLESCVRKNCLKGSISKLSKSKY